MLGETFRSVLDLVLPDRCAGCQTVGTSWCSACTALLAGPPRRSTPDPCPPGLPPTWTVARYDGPVRAAVVAYKEEAALRLATPLGQALARSVGAAIAARTSQDASVLLLPAPSRAAAVRGRGHDPTLRLARSAAGRLRAADVDVRVARLLRLVRPTRDQAGLGIAERAANLAGAVRLARWSPSYDGSIVVLVDDVVTSGATLAECARALRAHGVTDVQAATVAATARDRAVIGPL